MNSRIKFFLLAALFIVCQIPAQEQAKPDALANHIQGELSFLADDALRGRGSGTADELLAAVYLASQLRELGIQPAGDHGGYIQDVSGMFRFFNGPRQWHTRNVIGVLPGHDEKLKEEVILLTAHLDHLGIGKPLNGDEIYNGADDDASGCVAVLELAR